MADDNTTSGSSILKELDASIAKEMAEKLRGHIQESPVHIDNAQSGQLSPPHTPGQSR